LDIACPVKRDVHTVQNVHRFETEINEN